MLRAQASTSSASHIGPARRRATGVGKSARLTYLAAVRRLTPTISATSASPANRRCTQPTVEASPEGTLFMAYLMS